MDSNEQAVLKGAELLDRENPGWADKIDLEYLKLDSCLQCVLGQLYGDYREGKKKLGLLSDLVTLPIPTFEYGFNGNVVELEEYWIREIKKRQTSKETT